MGTPPSPMPRQINYDDRGNARNNNKNRVYSYNKQNYSYNASSGNLSPSSDYERNTSSDSYDTSGYDRGERSSPTTNSPLSSPNVSSKLNINDAMEALRAKQLSKNNSSNNNNNTESINKKMTTTININAHHNNLSPGKLVEQMEMDMRTSPPKLATSPIKVRKMNKDYSHTNDDNRLERREVVEEAKYASEEDDDEDTENEEANERARREHNNNNNNNNNVTADDSDNDNNGNDNEDDDADNSDDNSNANSNTNSNNNLFLEEFDDEIENLAHGNVHANNSNNNQKKKSSHRVSLVRSSAESGDWSVRS